jgi:hypothetical protein
MTAERGGPPKPSNITPRCRTSHRWCLVGGARLIRASACCRFGTLCTTTSKREFPVLGQKPLLDGTTFQRINRVLAADIDLAVLMLNHGWCKPGQAEQIIADPATHRRFRRWFKAEIQCRDAPAPVGKKPPSTANQE